MKTTKFARFLQFADDAIVTGADLESEEMFGITIPADATRIALDFSAETFAPTTSRFNG